MTPEQKSAQARQAAHASWARTPNRSSRTAPAHEGLEAYICRKYGVSENARGPERAKQIASARRAYFQALAARSVKKRAERRAQAAGEAA